MQHEHTDKTGNSVQKYGLTWSLHSVYGYSIFSFLHWYLYLFSKYAYFLDNARAPQGDFINIK